MSYNYKSNIGLRGYIGFRNMSQKGFDVDNISGGMNVIKIIEGIRGEE